MPKYFGVAFTLPSIVHIYDRIHLKGHFFDRTFSDLLFYQTQMFCQKCCSVKTEPIMFCQNSLKFCQTLMVTLTVCCSVKAYSHVWQNNFSVWQKSCQELGLFDRTSQKCLKITKAYWSRVWINILKNPRDKSCKTIFRNFCQEDFLIGALV